MGAMIVQHSELARAVLSEVGIYDTLREEDFPNGALMSRSLEVSRIRSNFGPYTPTRLTITWKRVRNIRLCF
jgi:hypothetical protein